MAQLILAACGGKGGREERDARAAPRVTLFLSFGVGRGTYVTTIEKHCDSKQSSLTSFLYMSFKLE